MTTTQTNPTFEARQLPSGQWRAFNLSTGEYHGQAFRHLHEAEGRCRRLATMYGGEFKANLTCDLCHEPILAGERYSDDGSEIAHTDCVQGWFSGNFGREAL